MGKAGGFAIAVALVVIALGLINALAGYTHDNFAGWVIQRVR